MTKTKGTPGRELATDRGSGKTQVQKAGARGQMTRLKRALHGSPEQCLMSSVPVLFLRVEPACVTAPTPQRLIRVSSVSSVHYGLTLFAAAASELEGVNCSP